MKPITFIKSAIHNLDFGDFPVLVIVGISGISKRSPFLMDLQSEIVDFIL